MRERILEAVKEYGWALKYASSYLKNDKEIKLEALVSLSFFGESCHRGSAYLNDIRDEDSDTVIKI